MHISISNCADSSHVHKSVSAKSRMTSRAMFWFTSTQKNCVVANGPRRCLVPGPCFCSDVQGVASYSTTPTRFMLSRLLLSNQVLFMFICRHQHLASSRTGNQSFNRRVNSYTFIFPNRGIIVCSRVQSHRG